MSLSLAQQRALAIVPKVSGLASALLSGLIAFVICRDPSKRSKVYHRLVLGMSLADVSSSLWLSLSTWPIPRETGLLWAVGNTTTCTFQGFFTQFGISSPIYNVSLSLYYVLAVRYNWREEQLRSVEVYLHSLPLVWATGTAAAGLFLEIFNSANLWCWIADYPGRHENTDPYRWGLFYGPLWLSLSLVTFNLTVLFLYVRKVTLRSERYCNDLETNRVSSFKVNPDAPHQKDGLRPSLVSSVEGVDRDYPNDDFVQMNNSVFYDQGFSSGSNPQQGALNATGENSEHSSNDSATSPENAAPDNKPGSKSRLSLTLSSFRQSRPFPARTTMRANVVQFTKRRKQVANQCLRYALAFYWTWIPISIVRILQTVEARPVYGFFLLAAMNTPFQGLPNCLVYLYPLFLNAKRQNPDSNVVRWLQISLSPSATNNPRSGVS